MPKKKKSATLKKAGAAVVRAVASSMQAQTKKKKKKKSKLGSFLSAGLQVARCALPVIMGSGEYKTNTFMNLLPMFPGSDQVKMGWEELIGFVVSSTELKVRTYTVNPGTSTFKRLRAISKNFQKFVHHGFYTGYISNVSTARTDSTTIGQVALFVIYDPEELAPATIAEVQMLTGTATGVGYQNLICPIECKVPGRTGLNYFIDHPGEDQTRDVGFREPFKIGVATWGFPTDGDNAGLLVATGNTEFIGRRVSESNLDVAYASRYDAPGGTYSGDAGDPLYQTSTDMLTSPVDLLTVSYVTQNTKTTERYTFGYTGYYLVRFAVRCSTGTPDHAPVLDNGSGCEQVDCPFLAAIVDGTHWKTYSQVTFPNIATDEIMEIMAVVKVDDVTAASWIEVPHWSNSEGGGPFDVEEFLFNVIQIPAALVLAQVPTVIQSEEKRMVEWLKSHYSQINALLETEKSWNMDEAQASVKTDAGRKERKEVKKPTKL